MRFIAFYLHRVEYPRGETLPNPSITLDRVIGRRWYRHSRCTKRHPASSGTARPMITGRGAADLPVRLPCPDAQICVHMLRAHHPKARRSVLSTDAYQTFLAPDPNLRYNDTPYWRNRRNALDATNRREHRSEAPMTEVVHLHMPEEARATQSRDATPRERRYYV